MASLPDVDDGMITVGMRARVTLDAYPEILFNGTIKEIAPMAQETSRQSLRRAFKVIVELDEIDSDRMRPGLSVRVEVERHKLGSALLVPRAAIDQSSTPSILRTLTAEIEVEVIACNAIDCAIEGDVDEGTPLRSIREVAL